MGGPSYNHYHTNVAAEEPLLEKDVEEAPYTVLPKAFRQSQRPNLGFHVVLVLLYTAVFVLSWLYMRYSYIHGPRLTYGEHVLLNIASPCAVANSSTDPVRSAIKYETQVFDHTQVFFNSTPKPYSGVPSPQKEAAWDDLLQNFNLRVTEDEMRHLGKLDDSLPLPDGGYFGSLTVFHQLHCIWRVQKALYPKYYLANLSEEEAFLNLGHSEHCLDVLRQSILCNADTSMITMKWAEQ